MTATTQPSLQHARFARKPASLEDVLYNSDPSAPLELIEIEMRKQLTESEYDTFANSLLEDREWLAGHGGHTAGHRRVVEVSAPRRRTLFVDPSGGAYGRYVGIAEETSPQAEDQASAIRWLIDNRRPEVSHEQAIRTLRVALSSDASALRTIDDLAKN